MAATILSHQSSTGFYKAPVCKGLLSSMFLTCTAIHVPMIAQHFRQYLSCEIPQILISPQIWRLLLNRLTFTHSKDLLCSALVFYYFRVFERRMGSRKFASHLLGSSVIATLLEISIIMILAQFHPDYQNAAGRFLPPGLYSLLFPLYVSYYLDIPRVTVTHILGIPVTGKTVTYLLGLQIACTSQATVISSLCGLVAGLLYRYNFLMVKKWLVVPDLVARICDKAFGWLLYSKEPKVAQTGATLELQRQEQSERWEQQYFHNRAQDFRQARGQGYSERLIDDHRGGPLDPMMENGGGLVNYFFRQRRAAGSNGPMGAPPSDSNIQTLVDMGFDRGRATEALRSSGNDLATATSILLQQ